MFRITKNTFAKENILPTSFKIAKDSEKIEFWNFKYFDYFYFLIDTNFRKCLESRKNRFAKNKVDFHFTQKNYLKSSERNNS